MSAMASAATPMVHFERISVRYEAKTAVSGVSGSVAAGEWVALVGANGAGKTSLLRALANLESHEGALRIAGVDPAGLSIRRRAQLVAYVPQSPELPPSMTVFEYTLLGRTPHLGYFASESEHDLRFCHELLRRLDVDEMADRPLATLSGGEVQRVILGRALAQEAPVLLLDEPTSALDLARRVDVLELVDELRVEHGLTAVSAMHDLTLAAQFADRLWLMADGSLVASGTPAEVLKETVLARYLGAPVRVLEAADGGIVVAPPGRARSRLASSGPTASRLPRG